MGPNKKTDVSGFLRVMSSKIVCSGLSFNVVWLDSLSEVSPLQIVVGQIFRDIRILNDHWGTYRDRSYVTFVTFKNVFPTVIIGKIFALVILQLHI